jgi:hypothetical protein
MKTLTSELNAYTSKQTTTHYSVNMTWTPEEIDTPVIKTPSYEAMYQATYKVVEVYVDESWTDSQGIPTPFFWMKAVSIRKDGSQGTRFQNFPYYREVTEAAPKFKLRMMQLHDKYYELAHQQVLANNELGFICFDDVEAN